MRRPLSRRRTSRRRSAHPYERTRRGTRTTRSAVAAQIRDHQGRTRVRRAVRRRSRCQPIRPGRPRRRPTRCSLSRAGWPGAARKPTAKRRATGRSAGPERASSGSATRSMYSTGRLSVNKKSPSSCWGVCPPRRRRGGGAEADTARLAIASMSVQAYAASDIRIFCSALASICRIRSAETPNSAASSCRVAVPTRPSASSSSQRASMIRRLRASRPCDGLADALGLQDVVLPALQDLGRLRVLVGEVRDRGELLLAVLDAAFERHIAASQSASPSRRPPPASR